MVMRREHADKSMAVPRSKPFPAMRPNLEIDGFTLSPRDFEDEIYIVPELVDELLTEDLVSVDGETMTSPERTLLDLATVTTGADLWRMLDNALTQGRTTGLRLRQAIAHHPRHSGSDRLATFLDMWSE
jgi:hypothetical protein